MNINIETVRNQLSGIDLTQHRQFIEIEQGFKIEFIIDDYRVYAQSHVDGWWSRDIATLRAEFNRYSDSNVHTLDNIDLTSSTGGANDTDTNEAEIAQFMNKGRALIILGMVATVVLEMSESIGQELSRREKARKVANEKRRAKTKAVVDEANLQFEAKYTVLSSSDASKLVKSATVELKANNEVSCVPVGKTFTLTSVNQTNGDLHSRRLQLRLQSGRCNWFDGNEIVSAKYAAEAMTGKSVNSSQ
ncbi:hypothetical protein VCHA53O466_320040 [Vibrio chagasii]|nr:hypothetical protein VCHA53O466_320040 [Vibrio chagasii]